MYVVCCEIQMCTRLNSVIKSGVVILNRLLLSDGKCMKRGNDSLAFVVQKIIKATTYIECCLILVRRSECKRDSNWMMM